ncbi:MAG: ABC transporter permease [Bacillota bacterium]|nr:ABC transporter permease [Bacillota bacterium]
MIKLIKNELIKLGSGRRLQSFLLLLVASQLIPVLVTFVSGIKAFEAQTYPLSMLGFTASWLLPIFLIVIIAQLVTDEYSSGTLVLSLIHPVSRGKLLAAKLLTLLLLILGSLGLSLLLAYVIGIVFFGWSPDFVLRGVSYSLLGGITKTIGAHLVAALPLLAFSALVLLLALTFNSSSVVVGIAVSLLFASMVLGQAIPSLRPFLITFYFTDLSYSLFFSEDSIQLTKGFVIVGLYGLIPYAISNIIFKRRDLL